MPRMDAMEYAAAVVDEITKRTTCRFWYGNNADGVKMSTTSTAVPQSVMVCSILFQVLGMLTGSRTMEPP